MKIKKLNCIIEKWILQLRIFNKQKLQNLEFDSLKKSEKQEKYKDSL